MGTTLVGVIMGSKSDWDKGAGAGYYLRPTYSLGLAAEVGDRLIKSFPVLTAKGIAARLVAVEERAQRLAA